MSQSRCCCNIFPVVAILVLVLIFLSKILDNKRSSHHSRIFRLLQPAPWRSLRLQGIGPHRSGSLSSSCPRGGRFEMYPSSFSRTLKALLYNSPTILFPIRPPTNQLASQPASQPAPDFQAVSDISDTSGCCHGISYDITSRELDISVAR